MPRWPAAGSTVANTMKTSASAAFVIQSLRPVSTQSLAVPHRARGQGERVAAGRRLGQRVGSDGAVGEGRQQPALLLVRAPAQQRVDDQRVLHVADHRDSRVDPRQLLHGENRQKEMPAGAAPAFRDLDAHDAEPEQLVDELPGHAGLVVHPARERRDLGFGERPDGGAQQAFLLREAGERRRGVSRFGCRGVRPCSCGAMVSLEQRASLRGHL